MLRSGHGSCNSENRFRSASKSESSGRHDWYNHTVNGVAVNFSHLWWFVGCWTKSSRSTQKRPIID